MTRTGWTMVVVGLLVVGSLCVYVTRRATAETGGTSWQVTLTERGVLKPGESLRQMRAPDFRRQHVFNERFVSDDLTRRVPRKKPRSTVTWRRSIPVGDQPFTVSYTFRCTLSSEPPDAKRRRADELDQAPEKDLTISKSANDDKVAVTSLVKEILENKAARDPADRIHAFYDQVTRYSSIAHAPVPARFKKSGDEAGRSRLLVALCRNDNIPARVVTGITLGDNPTPPLLHWVEAWDGSRWWPMSITDHTFGPDEMPSNRLVLALDDLSVFRLMRPRQPDAPGDLPRKPPKARKPPHGRLDEFTIKVEPPANRMSSSAPGWLRNFWRWISIASLRPSDQQLVRFLLLLPLAALIVSVYRTIIGVPTFGTFSPALLGLAFLNLRALPWGLGIFFTLVMLGWGMRHSLERFHLLQVPRTSALLTMVIMLLLVLVILAGHLGVASTQYVALFPLVILTHLIERFWTVEAEDGTRSSFYRLLGTAVVTVTISVCLAQEAVPAWMTRYPETLGIVLASQILLGRYTGYRLSELYRFSDLYREGDAPPPDSEPVSPSNGTTGGNGVHSHPPRQTRETPFTAGGAS